ncbi:MAG: hypothetical protein ACYDEQ_04165 [Desulfocucumaceae bacterium]
MIINKKQFYIGLTMLVVFAILLVAMLSPINNGQTVIQTADNLFNSLTKGSTYYIPKIQSSADKFEGTAFDVTVSLKSAEEVTNISKVFITAGAIVETIDTTKVKISGDLGKTAKAALLDSDALFRNDESKVSSKYDMRGKDALYYWWTGFNALESKYKLENKSSEMSFVGSLKGKALEVAYNFEGIQADKVNEKAGITTFMLAFYIIYTVWYGFAIMFILEGLGIVASSHGEKAEA